MTSTITLTTFGSVPAQDNSIVNIPDAIRDDFQKVAAYCSLKKSNVVGPFEVTNAHMDVTKPDDEAGAKLFYRMAKQWAESTGRSAAVTRDGRNITLRFAKRREASQNGPVTVTSANS